MVKVTKKTIIGKVSRKILDWKTLKENDELVRKSTWIAASYKSAMTSALGIIWTTYTFLDMRQLYKHQAIVMTVSE